MHDFQHSPYWHAAQGLPAQIYAGQTFAIVDKGQDNPQPFLQQNLALHVGDDANQVQQRRMNLLRALLPFGAKRLQWLNQTHSTQAYCIEAPQLPLQNGDALLSTESGVALMMMTADCLPIVLCDALGQEVACLHAGWRGLANGIIEKTYAAMRYPARLAWLGVAISQNHFEVGGEVREAFISQNPALACAFKMKTHNKYMADLYAIARIKLQQLGITTVSATPYCSYADQQFYSYRRAATTGRMATFVFIAEKDDKLK